jgi:dolichyl-phosphate-mannose-protein mannosyltransferase
LVVVAHAEARGGDAASLSWRPVSGREALIVAVLTIAAFVLRAWSLGTAGLSQFDEGVYTFSALGLTDPSQPHRLFPDQQKFSPPVYFSLVALSYLITGGPSDRAAILVNVVLGALTVPLIWIVARAWFGPAAGVASAALLALNEFHIVMSRSALTDVAFAFFFLVAIATLVWAVEKGGLWRAVIAGLTVGVAWNTKYHGWFALVIVGGGVLGRWWFGGASRAWFRRSLGIGIVAGVVGLLCYAPWALFIQQQSGSTGGWARYFATMLELDWFGNLYRHMQQQALLEGPISRASIPVAVLLSSLVESENGEHGAVGPLGAVVLGLLSFTIGAAGTALLIGLFGLALLLARRTSLDGWVLAAWLLLWFVAAPVYHPYFRLLLPFTIATFLLAGSALGDALTRMDELRQVAVSRVVAVVSAAIVLFVSLRGDDLTNPWHPSRSLAAAADSIAARLPDGAPVKVVGEPPLSFYLHMRGHPSFDRFEIAEVDSAREPMYLVTGRYTRRAPILAAMIERHRAELQELGRVPVSPSDLRLLDDFNPGPAADYRARPDSSYDLIVYRFTPRGGPQ